MEKVTLTVNAGCALSGDYCDIPRKSPIKPLETRIKKLSKHKFNDLLLKHRVNKTYDRAVRIGKRANCTPKKKK